MINMTGNDKTRDKQQELAVSYFNTATLLGYTGALALLAAMFLSATGDSNSTALVLVPLLELILTCVPAILSPSIPATVAADAANTLLLGMALLLLVSSEGLFMFTYNYCSKHGFDYDNLLNKKR